MMSAVKSELSAEKKRKRSDLQAQIERLGFGRDAQGRRINTVPSDEIRRAVKKSAPRPVAPPREKQILYRRDIPRQTAKAPLPRRRSGRSIVLEQAVDGEEVMHTTGTGFVISTRADEAGCAQTVSDRFRELMLAGESSLCTLVTDVCESSDISCSDIIFMDVESTGLGNSPLFLIGVMTWEGDCFEIQQFFARNYAEEAAVVSFFLEACTAKQLLITFNGKSFDVPYIRARAASNAIPFTGIPHHLDMLHVCRRIWRRELPDCKLQTLEKFICKRVRHGDIPGSEIPDAYHEFVRSLDARQMLHVLKHNMLDLITMADLMSRFPPVKG